MADQQRFKIAFPKVRMPDNRGGKLAAVIFALRKQGDTSGVILATCIDEDGTPHMNVPFTMGEMMEAPHMVLVETPGERAPSVGGGGRLVGPDGRAV